MEGSLTPPAFSPSLLSGSTAERPKRRHETELAPVWGTWRSKVPREEVHAAQVAAVMPSASASSAASGVVPTASKVPREEAPPARAAAVMPSTSASSAASGVAQVPTAHQRDARLAGSIAQPGGARPVLKTLTVKQPFAAAILAGRKRVENRTWKPENFRPGTWYALHTSREMAAPDDDNVKRLRQAWPRTEWPHVMPRGSVVGFFRVSGFRPANALRDDVQAVGPWCWIIDRTVALDRPVQARGMMGLWPCPATIPLPQEVAGVASGAGPRPACNPPPASTPLARYFQGASGPAPAAAPAPDVALAAPPSAPPEVIDLS